MDVIKENPIGKHLDGFLASFKAICKERNIACNPDAVGQLDQEDLYNLTLDLLSALQGPRASRLLRSKSGSKNLSSDLARLCSSINDDFNFERVNSLFQAVLTNKPDNEIWAQVYKAVTESTLPPQLVASSLQQTPWLRNTSSFVNTSEHRKYMDHVLKEELGVMYVDISGFRDAFFGGIPDLQALSEATFEKCCKGPDPLFHNGWRGWPQDTNEKARRPVAKPAEPIQGSTGERKLDIGFVDNPRASSDTRCHWSQILIPGELKSNPLHDVSSKARLDIGKYAREVLAAQDTCRFVLGFTLYGLQFVSICFFLESPMKRALCIAGRATTCWKAYREGDDQRIMFVVKDSWQYIEQDEEGELLRAATKKDVVNVARYYHHETASNYRSKSSAARSSLIVGVSRKCQSSNVAAGVKRLSSQSSVIQPPNKRSRPTSSRQASKEDLSNWVRRRIIVRDYGKPIYRATSRSALLATLDDCIKGHKSLASGGKIGTRAFMAIGFEDWNFVDTARLVTLKTRQVAYKGDFIRSAEKDFTLYYQPLISWVNRLQKAVFPNGLRWKLEDAGLYSRMREILQDARRDTKVLGET
ncbi:hypothetical protein F5883DRAFT_605912 [Diaporthe sp. PMI_573]|nr:hypothetical protein F5883DRAFT_605912 [Diaporthaceae sp. PMI_573]